MLLEIKDDEKNALKWLLLRGMEQTNSNKKFEIFERLSDKVRAPEKAGREASAVNARVIQIPKQGRDCLIWRIKNNNNAGYRFIITSDHKESIELVEGRLDEEEYVDICHTLSGHLEASVEVFV